MRLRAPQLKPWQWAALVLAAVGAAVLGWWFLRQYPVGEWIAQGIESVKALGPVPFFAALAVLPAFGAPVAPFYLAGGAAFSLPVAIGGSLMGLTLNLAFSYVLARWLLHPVVERIVVRFGYKIPVVRPEDRIAVTLLVRITPGPPFFVQSYLLGLAGVPFGTYMLVSTPVCALMATAVIVFGDSLTTGSAGQIAFGVMLIVAALLIVRLARRMMQRRAAAAAAVVAAAEARTAEHGPGA